MATYKVIQDIEAEDKFLGPLTLKQFVFGAGGIFFAYLSFFAVSQGFEFALIFFAPPMLLGFFLAVPWSKDQPTEVWVLAKLRFRFKPRQRIWDQSGMEELVTITAPKKVEKVLTDNLSQVEVKSRLQALAETIDSRGWAVKHAELQADLQPHALSDRLVSPSILPQEVPMLDLDTVPDVLGENTAASSNLDRMMQQSNTMRTQQSLDKMDRVRQGESLSAVQQPQIRFTPPPLPQNNYGGPAVDPVEEAALTAQLKSRHVPNFSNKRMRTLQPIDPNAIIPDPVQNPYASQTQTGVPDPVSPAILNYANNDDLDVATIARQAKKDNKKSGEGEVVITLR